MINVLLTMLDEVHPYFIHKPMFKLKIKPLWKLRNCKRGIWN